MLSRWWLLGEALGGTRHWCEWACVLRCLGEVGGRHFRGHSLGFSGPRPRLPWNPGWGTHRR